MRKFINAIKVFCVPCDIEYWKEAMNGYGCAKCGDPVTESMSQADYEWKRQLDTKNK